MLLGLIAYFLQAAAWLTAIAVAIRRRSYRPVALFLSVVVLAEWLAIVVENRFPAIREPGPLQGVDRLAFHVDQASFVAVDMALVWIVLLCLRRKNIWRLSLTAWSAIVVSLAVSYPALRGALLARVYLFEQLACVLLSGAVLLWSVLDPLPRVAGLERFAIAFVVTFNAATLVAFRSDVFRDWWLAWNGQFALYALLTIMQGGTLCKQRRSN